MEGFLCAASENSFSTLWLCRFLVIPGNRLPLSGWSSEMLLFVPASAYFSVSTLFHPWSGSRLLPTPLTSLLDSVSVGPSSQQARESPCSAGTRCQRCCSSHQCSQHDSACFVLWFCTELQQLPAVPRRWPAGILCSLSPGMLSPAFPEGSKGRRCCVLPVLAASFGIEAGCQPSGGADAAWPGICCWWSQKIHGKLGE